MKLIVSLIRYDDCKYLYLASKPNYCKRDKYVWKHFIYIFYFGI